MSFVNLKPQFLIKSDYYIVPRPSIALDISLNFIGKRMLSKTLHQHFCYKIVANLPQAKKDIERDGKHCILRLLLR